LTSTARTSRVSCLMVTVMNPGVETAKSEAGVAVTGRISWAPSTK